MARRLTGNFRIPFSLYQKRQIDSILRKVVRLVRRHGMRRRMSLPRRSILKLLKGQSGYQSEFLVLVFIVGLHLAMWVPQARELAIRMRASGSAVAAIWLSAIGLVLSPVALSLLLGLGVSLPSRKRSQDEPFLDIFLPTSFLSFCCITLVSFGLFLLTKLIRWIWG